jgi:propionate CoA-transferase
MTIDGKDYLRYLPIPVDVALLRGSVADEDGNISLEEEPANLDIYAMAAAAHNSGGKVIFQVKRKVARGSLTARQVRIPSALVDAVVIDSGQRQGYELVYDAAVSGQKTNPDVPREMPAFSARMVIARRARTELHDGAVVNYGFGIPDQVAKIVAAEHAEERYYQTIEHGTYGGTLLDGDLFGYALNPSCMIDGPSQFDFYSGGGLDIAFLGFGEIDAQGNVNVSKLAGNTVGPGGFIDIAQNAAKVVFCGTFDTGCTKLAVGDGTLSVITPGRIGKFKQNVDQITFSGAQALSQKQDILYVTERAVFQLTKAGVCLIEIAPGIDLHDDILDKMSFTPLIADNLKIMDTSFFTETL